MQSSRELQIQILHQSIAQYQPATQDLQALNKAFEQLTCTIEQKFQKSAANQEYKFPRQTRESIQYCEQLQTINLYQDMPISLDISIAEEPSTNPIYCSEKTNLLSKKELTPIKIKLFKKKDPKNQKNQTRLKTQYREQQKTIALPTSKINFNLLKQRMNIKDMAKSPIMKTQHTPIRNQGRSFERIRSQLSKSKERKKKEDTTTKYASKTSDKKNMSIKIHAKVHNKENKEVNKEYNSKKTEESRNSVSKRITFPKWK